MTVQVAALQYDKFPTLPTSERVLFSRGSHHCLRESRPIVVSTLIAILIYGLATARIWHTLMLADEDESNEAARLDRRYQTMGLATIALILHGWIVFFATGLPANLHLPFYTSLMAVSMVMVLLHITVCLKQPASYLGLAIYPLAALSLLAWLLFGRNAPISDLPATLQTHVFLSLLAYSILALAALQAVLLAIQRQLLKNHRASGKVRALPPLDVSEELLFTLLGAGFALLTLALGSGFVQLDDMFAQHLVHKTLLSCLAWVIFGVVLFGRWRFGWRGSRVLKFILAGFAVLILAYFGSKFVIEVLLPPQGMACSGSC